MSSNKRKVKKYRGSKTHGGGSMKKRRGAGSRGGRGNSGRGKRADQKKPSIWKLKGNEKPYLGKYGFTSIHPDLVTINVSDLEKQASSLLEQGAATQKKDVFVVDLSKVGIDKLLGAGQLSTKVSVRVSKASSSAVRKVEDAGGSVELIDAGEVAQDEE